MSIIFLRPQSPCAIYSQLNGSITRALQQTNIAIDGLFANEFPFFFGKSSTNGPSLPYGGFLDFGDPQLTSSTWDFPMENQRNHSQPISWGTPTAITGNLELQPSQPTVFPAPKPRHPLNGRRNDAGFAGDVGVCAQGLADLRGFPEGFASSRNCEDVGSQRSRSQIEAEVPHFFRGLGHP